MSRNNTTQEGSNPEELPANSRPSAHHPPHYQQTHHPYQQPYPPHPMYHPHPHYQQPYPLYQQSSYDQPPYSIYQQPYLPYQPYPALQQPHHTYQQPYDQPPQHPNDRFYARELEFQTPTRQIPSFIQERIPSSHTFDRFAPSPFSATKDVYKGKVDTPVYATREELAELRRDTKDLVAKKMMRLEVKGDAGSRTNADFYDLVKERGTLRPFQEMFPDIDTTGDNLFKDLIVTGKEKKTVQPFWRNTVLPQLKEAKGIKYDAVMGEDHAIERKSPDVLFYQQHEAHCEYFLSTFGELKGGTSKKPQRNGKFKNSVMGQLLSYGHKLLVREKRVFVVGYLSDGKFIAIYKMWIAEDSAFEFEFTTTFSLANEGGQYLSAILRSPPCLIGARDLQFSIPDRGKVVPYQFLGRGGHAEVFAGSTLDSAEVVIKIFAGKKYKNLEKQALDKLRGCPLAPKLLASGKHFLITEPRGEPFIGIEQGQHELTLEDVVQVIDLLAVAHSRDLYHNDFKLSCLYRINQSTGSNLLVNDWSSASIGRDQIPFRGTQCFAPRRVLAQSHDGGEILYMPHPSDDMVGLVKAIYSHQKGRDRMKPLITEKSNIQIIEFWDKLNRLHRWKRCLAAAGDGQNMPQIPELKKALADIFDQ